MQYPNEHPLSRRERAERLIDDELRRCGVNRLPRGATDLTHLDTEEILGLCRKLVNSGLLVLHGSFSGPVEQLKPCQANDAAKKSGNERAIYATVAVEAALMHAIVNKPYLLSTLSSYTLGYAFSDGRIRFRASDNLYQLFLEHAQHLYADGYIHVLGRDEFTKAFDSATEYQSLDSVAPVVVLKIPGCLGDDLFIIGRGADDDTVVEYSCSEHVVIDAHVRRLHSV